MSTGTARGVVRRVGRIPKEYLDYRFDLIDQLIRIENQLTREVTGDQGAGAHVEDAIRESAVLAARQVLRTERAIDELLELVGRYEAARKDADEARSGAERARTEHERALAQWQEATATVPDHVEDLGDRDRRLLDFANSHRGYVAQAGLWFNPPLSVAMTPEGPAVADVNERVGEVPFVFQSLHGLPAGADVLDVGSAESLVPLSLASLGYHVTALDPRGYGLRHPHLKVSANPIEVLPPTREYDAIVCLSTIEHLGIGAYNLQRGDRLDLEAMSTMASLLKEDGRLVLTVPCADESRQDELQRVYDDKGLDELLDGWTVTSRSYLVQRDRVTWMRQPELPRGAEHAAALITATREVGE